MKIKNTNLAIIFLRFGIIINLFFVSVVSFSQEKIELSVVRGDGQYPPSEFLDKQKKLKGIHIDLVTAVAKSLGWNIKFESYPWQRAVNTIEQGNADAITYITKTAEREKFAWFEENIISDLPFSFFILKKNEKEISYNGDMQAFSKRVKNVGVIKGYAYQPPFDPKLFVLEQNRDEDTVIKKMLGGRMRVYIGEKRVFENLLQEKKLDDQFLALKPDLYSSTNYIAFSKKSKKSIEEQEQAKINAKLFSESLAKFKKSPDYINILKSYGIKDKEY